MDVCECEEAFECHVAVLQLLNADVEYKSTIVLYACECEEAFECNYLRYM